MNVVLVHGAWHGAWAWDGVVAELEARGVGVEAVELPFTGFGDDAAAAAAAIDRAGPDAVVCGHSYGGLVISAAARGLPVSRLVYLCALMSDEDEKPFAAMTSHRTALRDAMIDVDGRSGIDPDHARAAFYADADDDVVAAILPRLRTIPGRGAPPIDGTDPAWRHVPSTYVVCTRDQALHPDAQRHMARHATEVVEWDADHSPFLTRPGLLADLLTGG